MTAAAPARHADPRRCIKELTPGEKLDQVFLIARKDLRTTANGALYIHLVLADRTGQLLGRVWQASETQYGQIPDGGFLRLRGRTESYKGQLQFIVDGMQPVDASAVNVADFVPRTEHDVEEMWQRVLAVLRTVQNRHLLLLIKKFVEDASIVSKFKQSPAAMNLHHAFVGGLLEHTLSLLEVAALIFGRKDDSTSHYPKVSRDLVLTGLFLHDIGKAWELGFDTAFKYTDGGQLIGHIVQGAVWIDRKCGEVEEETGEPFPEELQQALTHIVLAHHGSYEFGSPKLPAMPEAVAVHHLDNLDAKLQQFVHAIESDADASSHWTDYVPSIQTRIFKRMVVGQPPKGA
jgi:3'-5' exoribonuclease